MSEIVGRPNGNYAGILASIPIGSQVRLLNLVTDDGVTIPEVAGIYKGWVFDVSIARIRLTAHDPRFANQNIAADKATVTELQVNVNKFARSLPRRWRQAPGVDL